MEKDNQTQNKIVQTYAEDMAELIENDRSGLIKKIIHEEEASQIEKKNLSPESKKNKFLMLVGLLFILLGLATLFYFLFMRQVPTVPIEKQFIPLVFTDKSNFIEIKDLKKDEIAQTIFNEVNTTEVKNGGVEGIYLTNDKKVVGLREFVTLIKSSFVPSESTFFVSDNFLTGVVNGETKDFFILIKVRSTADIFDSLRTWEKKMFFDLHGFFGINITSETNDLLTANFEDGIIENKNARILYQKDANQDKKIVMMYILADDNSVIITNTESAAHELVLRLAASRVKK